MNNKQTNIAPKPILLLSEKNMFSFLRSLFLILILTGFTSVITAQTISMNAQNVKLESVLASITKQTGLSFAYSKQVVNLTRRINLNLVNSDLNVALDRIVAGTNLTYEIKNGKIYLYEKPTDSSQVTPQRRKVSGIVVDRSGEPVIGANIVELGTTNGVTSDLDGAFSLDLKENASLQISYIGFITETIPVAKQSLIQITLHEDSKALEEVVVVGYGTMEKRHISSSISSIRGDNLIQGIGG